MVECDRLREYRLSPPSRDQKKNDWQPEMAIAETSTDTRFDSQPGIDSKVAPIKRKPRNPMVRWGLMVLRRSHLYFGLLLVPWAILYGVTAYLFNHPSHFSNLTDQYITAESIPDSWPTRTWNPADRALQIIDRLNTRFMASNGAIQLDRIVPPRFDGTNIGFSYEYEGRNYLSNVTLTGDGGLIRSQPTNSGTGKTGAAFFEVNPTATPHATQANNLSKKASKAASQIESKEAIQREQLAAPDIEATTVERNQPILIDEELRENLLLSIQDIAKAQDHSIEKQQIKIGSVPDLVFVASAGENRWNCRYSALNGSVKAKPIDLGSANDFSWRRFFLRLHTAHGYPHQYEARWFWAIIVDIMAFVMVFWGVSGLVMWWQIKSVRRSGSIAMAVSLLIAMTLGVAMFQGM